MGAVELEDARGPRGCGFLDVRNNPDGTYECAVCHHVYPPKWLDEIRAQLGPRAFKRVNEKRMLNHPEARS